MSGIRLVSLDLEGTIVTPAFSEAVWHEGLPALYAEARGLTFEEAKSEVERQYDEVGDGRSEWYDIKYWFRRFGLGGHESLLSQYSGRVVLYSDAREALSLLARRYTLVISSASAREFLPHLLAGAGVSFARVFSSVSDYGQLKTAEFYGTVCREMGAQPCEVVHVGDSWLYDYLSPREAGLRAFHLDRSRADGTGASLSNLMAFADGLEGGF
jgi:FMN phosphatase YigB (HAD superfamily)